MYAIFKNDKFKGTFKGSEETARECGYIAIPDELTQYIPYLKKVSEEQEVTEEVDGQIVTKTVTVDTVVLDEEAWSAHLSDEQAKVAAQEVKQQIAALKAELAKVKEDIEQVEFGLVRDDYEEKKARACELINAIRVLEGKEPRATIKETTE